MAIGLVTPVRAFDLSGEFTLSSLFSLGEQLWHVQGATRRQRSRVSDAHVYADDLTGWFMRDVGSRIGEAYKPSPGSVFGDSGRRSRRDILPRTSHTKLHPAACGNEDLAPLAVEPSNGQVPYGKAFVDVLLVPG